MPDTETWNNVTRLVAAIDWDLLARQKLALLAACRWADEEHYDANQPLNGILNLIGGLQEAAHSDGWPVVWLETGE